MNKKRFIIFVGLWSFIFCFNTSAQENTLSQILSQAVSRGDASVKFSYATSAHVQENDVRVARHEALENAFHEIVKAATEQFVSLDRIHSMDMLLQNKIYKKARIFISYFHPLKFEILNNEYHSSLEITLNLKALQNALVELKVLEVIYGHKEVHFLNVKKFQDYQFLKEALEKRLQGVKKIVEVYQKEGEIRCLLEVSSSVDETIGVLNQIKNQEGAPSFNVSIAAADFVAVTFLK